MKFPDFLNPFSPIDRPKSNPDGSADPVRRSLLGWFVRIGIAQLLAATGCVRMLDSRNFDANSYPGELADIKLPERGEVDSVHFEFLMDHLLAEILETPYRSAEIFDFENLKQDLYFWETFHSSHGVRTLKIGTFEDPSKPGSFSLNNGPGENGEVIISGHFEVKDGQVVIDIDSPYDHNERLTINAQGLIFSDIYQGDSSGNYYFTMDDLRQRYFDSTNQLLDFLALNQGYDYPVKKASLRDITDIGQVIQLFSYFAGDPENFTAFTRSVVHYSELDRSEADEFRHPVSTLSWGWGECDDFALLNAFWARLNGYETEILGLDDHIIVRYLDGEGRYIILDNDIVIRDKSLEEYLEGRPILHRRVMR